MNYDQIIEGYTPELQLLDAIDLLKHYHPDAAEILDLWASQTSNDKNDVEPLQKGPTD
jgi:hypothetical protein